MLVKCMVGLRRGYFTAVFVHGLHLILARTFGGGNHDKNVQYSTSYLACSLGLSGHLVAGKFESASKITGCFRLVGFGSWR